MESGCRPRPRCDPATARPARRRVSVARAGGALPANFSVVQCKVVSPNDFTDLAQVSKGRWLTVVLTGNEAMAYRLRCRSAPAVHEFAQAVHRALPVRDADEPRPDRAGLVTEKPLERSAPNRVRLLWWGLGGGYVLVLVLLPVKGAFPELVPGLLWAVAPLVVAGGVGGLQAGWQVFREPWVLHTRGITVEGELQGTYWYEGGNQHYYAYVDSGGIRRECKSPDGGAERAEISYDPADPDTAMVGHRTTGWLVLGAVLILLAGAVLLADVAFVVVSVVVLVN